MSEVKIPKPVVIWEGTHKTDHCRVVYKESGSKYIDGSFFVEVETRDHIGDFRWTSVNVDLYEEVYKAAMLDMWGRKKQND